MNLPVLMELIANNGFRDTRGLSFRSHGGGSDPRRSPGTVPPEIDRRMAGGAIVVPLEITPTEQNPWGRGAGMFRDNPLVDE